MNNLAFSHWKARANLIKKRKPITFSSLHFSTLLTKAWVWPIFFLLILIYANLGPILWWKGLIGQNFGLLCPEYIGPSVFFFSCGFGVFLLGYGTKFPQLLASHMPTLVLDLRTVDRLRLVLYLVIVISLGSLIYNNWPLSNLWSSHLPRGYRQFEQRTPSDFLELVSVFALPLVGFIGGFFYRRFPGFGGIVASSFFMAGLDLLAFQNRAFFIMVLLAYGLGRIMAGSDILWSNLLKIAILLVLSLLIMDFIGKSRSMARGTGVRQTLKGGESYLEEREMYNDSVSQIFPESGEMHYLTKVMDLNNNKSYMPLSEFLIQFDPLPSFFGQLLYWDKERGWFTSNIGLWGKVGAPLCFGSIAYAGLGFWGVITFIPVGIFFRLAQLQILAWTRSDPKLKMLSFVYPIFVMILITSTLIAFTNGGIRTWLRLNINFWVFIWVLKKLGILIIPRSRYAHLSAKKNVKFNNRNATSIIRHNPNL